ncbi:MAG: NAD(P)/FAD-dependent oxidoreductase [Melioribacteraceae bacterium]
MENNFDVIIIGSGISSLTAASILTKLGKKKVLILEKHFKIGGFTHIFKRKGDAGNYKWDVGLHYVGDMMQGSFLRKTFNYISNDAIRWHEMPEIYDVFVYPGFSFKTRKGLVNLREDLISAFPDEKNAIIKYFYDIKKAGGWLSRYSFMQTLPVFLRKLFFFIKLPGRKNALSTLKEYLDANIKDEKLRAIFASQGGDYGLPPSKVAFVTHALIVNHYINGGYYPAGGSKTIADSISPIIQNGGGVLKISAPVQEIIIKDSKAIGVKVNEKTETGIEQKEYFADKIISTAGAYITYTQLIPKGYAENYKEEIKDFPHGSGHINIYLGLKENPKILGFAGENYWLFNSSDHEKIWNEKNDVINGNISMVYLSFPSIKDPIAEGHTAEIIIFVDYSVFSKWADQKWKERDEEYMKIKELICNNAIDFVESHFKGFKKIIDYKEVSTPLSTEHFTGNPGGTIYGIPAIPKRYKVNWISPITPVKNLYLSGADSMSLGIAGAMMSGVITSGLVLNNSRGLINVFKEISKTN